MLCRLLPIRHSHLLRPCTVITPLRSFLPLAASSVPLRRHPRFQTFFLNVYLGSLSKRCRMTPGGRRVMVVDALYRFRLNRSRSCVFPSPRPLSEQVFAYAFGRSLRWGVTLLPGRLRELWRGVAWRSGPDNIIPWTRLEAEEPWLGRRLGTEGRAYRLRLRQRRLLASSWVSGWRG